MSAAVVAPPHLGAELGAAVGWVGGGVAGPAAAGPQDRGCCAAGAAGAATGAGAAFALPCAGFKLSLRGAGTPGPFANFLSPPARDTRGKGGKTVRWSVQEVLRKEKHVVAQGAGIWRGDVPGLPSRFSKRSLSPRSLKSLRPLLFARRSKARRSGACASRDGERNPVSNRRGVFERGARSRGSSH